METGGNKESVEDPEIESISDISKGQVLRGYVKAVTDVGVFVRYAHTNDVAIVTFPTPPPPTDWGVVWMGGSRSLTSPTALSRTSRNTLQWVN